MREIRQKEGLQSLKTKEAVLGIIFVTPSMSGFLVFYFLPYIKSLFYCFTSGIGIRFVGIENFVDLLTSEPYQLALKNTLVFLTVAIPLIIMISFIFALLLKNASKILTVIIIIPLVIPAASITSFFKFIFSEYGIVNEALSKVNIQPINFFDSGWSSIILITVFLWKYFGYNTILYLTALNNIPVQYYESAVLDGAGRWKCLIHITIPFSIPVSFFVFIVSFVNSFKIFREIILLFGIYPNDNVYIMQHFMNNNFLNLSYQRLSTAAFLMIIIIVAIVILCYRLQENTRKGLLD